MACCLGRGWNAGCSDGCSAGCSAGWKVGCLTGWGVARWLRGWFDEWLREWPVEKCSPATVAICRRGLHQGRTRTASGICQGYSRVAAKADDRIHGRTIGRVVAGPTGLRGKARERTGPPRACPIGWLCVRFRQLAAGWIQHLLLRYLPLSVYRCIVRALFLDCYFIVIHSLYRQ